MIINSTMTWFSLTLAISISICVAGSTWTCDKPPTVVPCNKGESQSRWFYDAPTKMCRKYLFQNCLLGNNSFESHSKCTESCVRDNKLIRSVADSTQPKRIHKCQQTSDKGHCLYHAYSAQWLWYFNPVTLRCEQFLYSGCGGNENRFESKKLCWHTCGHLAKSTGKIRWGKLRNDFFFFFLLAK